MLNKDQYNQEEYNDYYRQASEGAEVGGSGEERGIMGKLILLLIILALAIAAYFGYKAMNNSSSEEIDTSLQVSAESSLPQSVQSVPEEAEVKPVEITEEASKPKAPVAVATTVATEVAKQGNMSQEQIAAVVAAVMQKMNQEQNTKKAAVVAKKDVVLLDKLANSEVDSVSSDLEKQLENINISQNTQVSQSKKKVDVYNKVSMQNVSGSDDLSQLTDQINALTEEKINKDKAANYTNSLQSEVSTRENEMRVIVVKKGDTLGKIAKRAYGNVMAYKKIYRANPQVTRPDRIYVGQKLRIPN